MLYLVHLPILPRGFASWARDRGLGPKGTRDDGAALHTFLSGVFGKAVLQPFRLFEPAGAPWSLYAYAGRDAAALADVARMVAAPEMLDAIDLDKLRSKPMPEPRAGQRLGFDLRLRPVRRWTDGNRMRERDAFVAEAVRRHPDDRDGMASTGRSRETVYRDWLSERLPGATLENARLARFGRQKVLRNGREIEGPDATFHGTLIVADPVAFSAMLGQGIGRHRAYGYGMMLLRPPDADVPGC
jgi:CRISPR system Cascade subunit CasE